MSMRLTLLFCFLLLYRFLSYGQEPALRVFNTKTGLQGTSFREIVQGKKGNLWIASDEGVTKYNGYGFINFSSDEGLYDEQIASIKPIFKGDIVAISKKGNLFKIQNDSVMPFENNRMLSRMVTHGSEINSMAVDVGDTIWLGLNNANYLLKLVPVNGSYAIKKIEMKTKATVGLINNQFFYSINNSSSNHNIIVWGSGINLHFDFKNKINHLSAYKSTKETVISCNEYLFKGNNLESYKLYDNINQLYIDEYDHIWLLFENLGLGYCNSSRPEDISVKIKNVDFLSFYRDYEGGSWLGSYDKGLYYIPSFNVFTISQKDGLYDEIITGLYNDNNRVLAGSANGNLYVIENYKAKLIANFNLTSVTQNQINKIFKSSDNYYWVACLHSSYRISSDFKEIIELKHHGKRLQGIKTFVQNNQAIWAGGEDELYSINNEPNHITFNDYDIHYKINAMAIDKKNEIWLGCNNGLWKFNQRFFKYFGFNNRWLKGKITDLKFDKNNVLWVATHNMGVLKIEKNNIKHYTRFNGLISNYINSITITGNNLPVIATNQGISYFNSKGIINYNSKNGLNSNNCLNLIDLNTEIWAATTKGISIIKPVINEFKPKRLKTHISKIYVNDKLQIPSSNAALILEHFQNNLEIHFNAVSFKNSGKTRYRYLLKGLNDHWRTTTSNFLRFPELNDGEYEFVIQAENSEGLWGNDLAQIKFKIKTPFYEQWWFILSILLVVAFFSGWFARLRLKKIHFKELRQAELRRRLIDLELQALRSQMNPHFIFNSINSIQHFVVNNNANEAQRYLSKFAKLMRNVLDNSKTSHIPLEKELQTLELYMQLESLRFDEHFDFEIKIDPSIDVGYTEIPSMLIQPYIENAIWHGLMHKEGKGKILVELTRISEKQIKCLIEDNGIGREKAIEYKSKNKIAHKSVGMMITKERLQILNKINDSDLSIKITDLKDENQKPLGTRVEIFVPIN